MRRALTRQHLPLPLPLHPTLTPDQAAAEFVLRFRGNASDKQASPLPVLSSSCSGWVCYAEKVQGAAVLPLLSRVKSPQQVGALSKSTK